MAGHYMLQRFIDDSVAVREYDEPWEVLAGINGAIGQRSGDCVATTFVKHQNRMLIPLLPLLARAPEKMRDVR